MYKWYKILKFSNSNRNKKTHKNQENIGIIGRKDKNGFKRNRKTNGSFGDSCEIVATSIGSRQEYNEAGFGLEFGEQRERFSHKQSNSLIRLYIVFIFILALNLTELRI